MKIWHLSPQFICSARTLERVVEHKSVLVVLEMQGSVIFINRRFRGARTVPGEEIAGFSETVYLLAHGDVAVIAPEDIIADRMGQYASGSAPEMLGQARAPYAPHKHLDIDYMQRRITEEAAGSHGLQDPA